MSEPVLDLDFVRARFPLLAKGGHAFFDNAAGTLVPRSVIDRMAAFMAECQVQPNNPYAESQEASRRLAEARALMAEVINASPDEVVIGHSTTNNVYVLANALRPMLRAGDEVVVTNLDHESNSGAWRRLADSGITVKEWRFNPETADLDLDDLKALMTGRTRLVCFTQCSNVTGTIADVAAIVRVIHEAGALACVDAVAYAPHRAMDVKALDVDFYLVSLYKLYGPHHALLYGKRHLLEQARGQNHFFIGENELPKKLNVGGYDYEVVGSLPGITDYLDALHAHHFPGSNAERRQRLEEVFAMIAAHEERLAEPFVDFLAGHPRIRLIGRATADRRQRAPTFSFVVDGMDSGEVPKALGRQGLGLTSGHFYAYRVVRDLGYLEKGGVVRASMVHYNTPDEVARLIEALDALV